MEDLVSSLKDMTDKVLLIRLRDKETYNHFMNLLLEAEQALISLEDNTSSTGKADLNNVYSLTSLQYDIEEYLSNGRLIPSSKDVKFTINTSISQEEFLKQKDIRNYGEFTDLVTQKEYTGTDILEKLKKQWDTKKDTFSPIEVYAIEKALTNCFISYQINVCKKTGQFPNDLISDFCPLDTYKRELHRRCIEKCDSMPENSLEHLEVENAILNWDLSTAVTNPYIWKMLSGTEVSFDNVTRNITGITEEVKTPSPTSDNKEVKEEKQEEALPPVTLDRDIPTGNAVLLVYEKTKANGSKVHKTAVKQLDEYGRFNVIFNKDQIVEIYFLEGTEQLKFTKNGKSKSNIAHLSDFPNLRSVYLPSTLKAIEQGYFLDVPSLRNIYLGKNSLYYPDKELVSPNVNIVENPHNDDSPKSIIEEPEESSMILRQSVKTSLGEHPLRPIKVPLEYGIFKKGVTRGDTDYVTEAIVTNGSKYFGREYETDEYESITVHGGELSAFKNLRRVHLPKSLYYVDDRTFMDCTNLEEVNIPEGIQQIKYGAFKNCLSLKSIDFPSTLTLIDRYAFENCDSLEHLTFPDNMDSIREGAFRSCGHLESVSFPDNFGYIGREAFKNCGYLKKVDLPAKSIDTIGENAFSNCNMERIVIPPIFKALRADAFKYCQNLREFILLGSKGTIEKIFEKNYIRDLYFPSDMTFEEAKGLFPNIYNTNYIHLDKLPEDGNIDEFVESQIQKYKDSKKSKSNDSSKEEPTQDDIIRENDDSEQK